MKGYCDVLLGLQWGDEGKGKIIDYLAPEYDIIARFQGGPNAGHSLVFDGKKYVLHTLPSGLFRPQCLNLIGNGVVVDPVTLSEELAQAEATGWDIRSRLFIARRAHLILPTHRMLDAASEQAKGKKKIGSTLRGIGPAYMDKTGRNGLRVGDIFQKDFLQRLEALTRKHLALAKGLGYEPLEIPSLEAWLEAVELLRTLNIVDGEYFLNDKLDQGARVLAEGAQGTLLDIDFGTYPYVTSSSTVAAGACTGLGLAPRRVRRVLGVFKAYCTRVGSGPFPTELNDATGEILREKGKEFGATTGRPRRCGWLDLPALRYAVMINGVTHLMMMKADVLCGFDSIRVATAYRTSNGLTDHLPYDLEALNPEPVFKSFKGWHSLFIESEHSLTTEFSEFVNFIEEACGLPISLISYGPDREETWVREAGSFSLLSAG
jgi:adenylosuccinate synthase